VSFLAVLHIADRPALFRRWTEGASVGGRCYIEDLCPRAPFAPRDLEDVRNACTASLSPASKTTLGIFVAPASAMSRRRT